MSPIERLNNWLEKRAASPAYGGLVLGFIGLCFFGAATNTMVGWLYVISGTIFALLGISAVLPPRSLRVLELDRSPIFPVSAGDELTVTVEFYNPTAQPRVLFLARDLLPPSFGMPEEISIEAIAPGETYRWSYTRKVKKRGIYHWDELELRTGAPIGLFWSRRQRELPARAVVYPTVIPLTQCALVDAMGEGESRQLDRDRLSQYATSGLTRGLRPYRYGDSPRLIHWRSSARYGELRVRELEISSEGQSIAIALDNVGQWEENDFEQAVIAAASLYFYAKRRQLDAQLWLTETGLIKGDRAVLEALAAVEPEAATQQAFPKIPAIWITARAASLSTLPKGSRWVLFPPNNESVGAIASGRNGLIMEGDRRIQPSTFA